PIVPSYDAPAAAQAPPSGGSDASRLSISAALVRAKAAKTSASATIRCDRPAPETCAETLTLTAKRMAAAPKTVGAGPAPAQIRAGRTKPVKVALNKAGRRALAARRRLSVTLTIRSVAGGRTTEVRRTLVFRAKRR